MAGVQECDEVDSVRLRVGGLPQHPRPPLNYQIVFSVEGLLNEYLEKAEILAEGEKREVDSLSGLEDIAFPPPFGTLEAFHTSGGISRLTHLLSGTVRNLDYKTIRYKGHCEKFKTLLDLGFASEEPLMVGGKVKTLREFFTDLLRKKLDYEDTDVILARATIDGVKKGRPWRVSYECIDYFDEAPRLTAMMRTTGFPTAIIARMLAEGTITQRGVMMPEECVSGESMITQLAKRNITIAKRSTERGS
jgi:lysine 6-dehydrogenase